jgi:hypothetical protein
VSPLPDWVHKDRGALYHSEYEIECEDHLLAIKLIGALEIAWAALEKARMVLVCKDAMKRIDDYGKPE